MRDSSGVAVVNRQNLEKAQSLLYEKAMQALSGARKVTMITVRIPVHGDRLGTPKASVEEE